MQTDATLLDVTCCVRLHTLLHVVAQSLKPVKLFSQQLPTFLLFLNRQRVAQQCWIRLHSSSNIVGTTNAHYAWITKTYGLYSSHDALQVPNLLGVIASVCTPLPTLTQQCWELLRPFARSLRASTPGDEQITPDAHNVKRKSGLEVRPQSEVKKAKDDDDRGKKDGAFISKVTETFLIPGYLLIWFSTYNDLSGAQRTKQLH